MKTFSKRTGEVRVRSQGSEHPAGPGTGSAGSLEEHTSRPCVISVAPILSWCSALHNMPTVLAWSTAVAPDALSGSMHKDTPVPRSLLLFLYPKIIPPALGVGGQGMTEPCFLRPHSACESPLLSVQRVVYKSTFVGHSNPATESQETQEAPLPCLIYCLFRKDVNSPFFNRLLFFMLNHPVTFSEASAWCGICKMMRHVKTETKMGDPFPPTPRSEQSR